MGPLEEFYRDQRYAGRSSSSEHGVGTACRRHGLSADEIRAAIIQARALAKKGSAKRQREYAERTAGKAIRQAE